MTAYILFTPARNEEENLPGLIEDVVSQEKRPKRWLILDDHSEDSTLEIIEDAEKRHDFITGGSVELEKSAYDYGRPNFVKIEGTERLIESIDEWDYLGILDADSKIGSNFYEKMIKYFENYIDLGVASGTYYEDGERMIRNYPRGSLFFTHECFEDINGYSNHNDSIIEAKKHGWKAETLPPKMIHTRSTNERKPDFTKGIHLYRSGVNIFQTFFISLSQIVKNGDIEKFVNYLGGYACAKIRNAEKYSHIELKNLQKTPMRVLGEVWDNRVRTA